MSIYQNFTGPSTSHTRTWILNWKKLNIWREAPQIYISELHWPMSFTYSYLAAHPGIDVASSSKLYACASSLCSARNQEWTNMQILQRSYLFRPYLNDDSVENNNSSHDINWTADFNTVLRNRRQVNCTDWWFRSHAIDKNGIDSTWR